MIEVTFDQMQNWLALFIWPFARIAGLISSAPLLNHSSIPRQVKIGLCLLLTVIISPTLPPLPDVEILSWANVGILIEQILIGVAIGFVMQIVFAIAQASGDFIGMQMGLGFASFFSAESGTNTMILARFFYIVSLLLFLSVNAHLLLINIISQSFASLPVAAFSLNANGFQMIAEYGATIFHAGLLLALPIVGILLLINISMGILNRSAPQFTVFSVGFPISLLAGILLFSLLLKDAGGFMINLFDEGLGFLGLLLEQFSSSP